MQDHALDQARGNQFRSIAIVAVHDAIAGNESLQNCVTGGAHGAPCFLIHSANSTSALSRTPLEEGVPGVNPK